MGTLVTVRVESIVKYNQSYSSLSHWYTQESITELVSYVGVLLTIA